MNTTKVQKVFLSFRKEFYSIWLTIEFAATPKVKKPQTQYDFEIDFIAVKTYRPTDIFEIFKYQERLGVKIPEAILDNVLKMYYDEQMRTPIMDEAEYNEMGMHHQEHAEDNDYTGVDDPCDDELPND